MKKKYIDPSNYNFEEGRCPQCEGVGMLVSIFGSKELCQDCWGKIFDKLIEELKRGTKEES